jgi:hypothetical protein
MQFRNDISAIGVEFLSIANSPDFQGVAGRIKAAGSIEQSGDA